MHQSPSLDGLAVVIVHWGDPAQTHQAVHHVRAHAALQVERLFLIENGASARLPDGRARVIRLPVNLGYAGGVNAGLRAAVADGARQVLIMNNDVLYRPGAAERMIGVLEGSRGRVGCVGAVLDEGDRDPVYGGGHVRWLRGRTRFAHRPAEAANLFYVTGAVMLLARACVEDAGLLPEHYFHTWEDVAYGARLRERGWGLAWAPTPVMRHARSRPLPNERVRTYYLVRNGALFVRAHAPRAARAWLVGIEGARMRWARERKRWEVVRALRDARAGVTGPLAEGVDLTLEVP